MSGRSSFRLLSSMLVVLLTACADAAPGPQRVLLLVLDTTHGDRMSCQGGRAGLTPTLDALAADGMRFDRAVSNTTWTLPATASLMTGRLPYAHGVLTTDHRMPEDALLVAELFAQAGWRTAAFVQMVYASDGYGLGQGFEHARYYSKEEVRPSDVDVVDEVLAWMDDAGDERAFLYVHLRRPHSPYQPGVIESLPLERGCPLAELPAGRALANADSMFRTGEELNDAQRAHIEHLYLGNLATIDRVIQPLLARAQADEEMLVVLTSDHGEGLGQHDYYGHGRHLHAENVDIPLVFRGPGVAGGVDTAPASLVDVLPTLAELCELPVPDGHPFDGRSLAARLRGTTPGQTPPVVLVSKHPNKGLPEVGVIEDDHKLVLTGDDEARLHHRLDDRGERRDLGAERPEVLARLREAARRYRDEQVLTAEARASRETPTVTDAQREALVELGYAGDGN